MRNYNVCKERRRTSGSRGSVTRQFVYFLFFFFFLRRTSGVLANGEGQLFRRVTVSPTRLTTANQTYSFKTFGRLPCAGMAAQTDWALLMCYVGDVCTLYDVLVSPFRQDSTSDAVVCYTRLDKECILDNLVVQNGATAVSSCTKMKCTDGTLTTVSTAPGTDNWYWVGIRNNVWLDGTQIPQNHWDVDEPDFTDQCGVVNKVTGAGLLYDGLCAQINHYSVCQFR
ncbi:uncharacterized protein [Macrobrachium rosenbergii]|uniref:uncharacterized protein isoform X2 n=1 Tax=Macrobrachium rosenbergii TaxID=79674 RepID=UPI0034D4C79B